MRTAVAAALTTGRFWLNAIVEELRDLERIEAAPIRWERLAGHSNEIHEVTFDDGRVLIVKRGTHEWSRSDFVNSALAAGIVAKKSDVLIPRPLRVPALALGPDLDVPLQAYWRIPLPTLDRLWPTLGERKRAAAMQSVGRLLARLHAIEAPVFGPIAEGDRAPDSLETSLMCDLHDRLLPAVYTHWPAGLRALEWLIDAIPTAAAGKTARPPAFIHHDVHIGNILCRVEDGRVEAVGVLDLDEARGSVPESDIASFHVLHGPAFERRISPALQHAFLEGYGAELDPYAVEYFRCVHLVNQGFSSGLLGHDDHAAAVADELGAWIGRLRGGGLGNPRPRSGRSGLSQSTPEIAEGNEEQM